ncbi:MAG: HesA/MoeB/ThiF family protein [Gammaproteobacteria bacterium]|nr:HesA/MoeB/ThiF family protein [Gammaproteobacteria bacterium]
MADRYARHHALRQVGAAGQEKLSAGTVLMIGAGGIGNAAASYLAASGVGQLLISDFDTVDATNLARQTLFTPADIGEPKAEVVAARLQLQNPDVSVTPVCERLQGDALTQAIATADVVLDGCDNFATRFLINDACVASQRRLISGSAIRMEGQLAVFGPDFENSSCYRCLYAEADESLDSCAGNGVLSPVPGVIGTLMAVAALKSLLGMPTKTSTLHLYDAVAMDFRSLQIGKRTECVVCSPK